VNATLSRGDKDSAKEEYIESSSCRKKRICSVIKGRDSRKEAALVGAETSKTFTFRRRIETVMRDGIVPP